jgi:hypothetical protein
MGLPYGLIPLMEALFHILNKIKIPMTASSDIFHDHVWYMSNEMKVFFILSICQLFV